MVTVEYGDVIGDMVTVRSDGLGVITALTIVSDTKASQADQSYT